MLPSIFPAVQSKLKFTVVMTMIGKRKETIFTFHEASIVLFFYLLFHRSFHLVKGIASNCGHARVKAFAVTKLSLPHPLVEIRRYIRQQRTAIHCLEFSFGFTPQTFNVVGVHAVGTHVFHRVVHCLVLVSQI